MTDDPTDLDRIDQEIRINELKHEAEDLAGGNMHVWEADSCPPDVSEGYWQSVVAYEKAPWTTNFEKLTAAGVELPNPATLSDAELSAKLWEVIRRLGEMRVFLSRTGHLSDRELYIWLWTDGLREDGPDLPADPSSAWHIDVLGGCSEEDIEKQHRYYASEEERAHWMKSFPDYEMPPHEDPPYDRDRHLPKSGF